MVGLGTIELWVVRKSHCLKFLRMFSLMTHSSVRFRSGKWEVARMTTWVSTVLKVLLCPDQWYVPSGIYIYVYLYVCMYVCMYVCKYVYMYVCIYIYVYLRYNEILVRRLAVSPCLQGPWLRTSPSTCISNCTHSFAAWSQLTLHEWPHMHGPVSFKWLMAALSSTRLRRTPMSLRNLCVWLVKPECGLCCTLCLRQRYWNF